MYTNGKEVVSSLAMGDYPAQDSNVSITFKLPKKNHLSMLSGFRPAFKN